MSTVETRVVHDWRLVAPWWHWPRRAGLDAAGQVAAAEEVRSTAPVLQKYDGPDFVNTFLGDPQRRLAFRSPTDVVRSWAPGGNGLGSLPVLQATGPRKLYLGAHHRHYLVVASLHCALPGFPHVDRSAVCEAGFVVRRRRTALATGGGGGGELLARLAAARRRRVAAEAQVAVAAQAGPARAVRLAALEARLRGLGDVEQKAASALSEWARASGATRALEGWVPRGAAPDGSVVPLPPCPPEGPAAGGPGAERAEPPRPLTGVGCWQAVGEVPELLDEATFPLHPLVADPTRPDHDAAGETLWFGVVPTSSSDVDPAGNARFDDRSTYEIRCFVRRHRPECPVDGQQCRCPITWSEPTEPYRLASHFDLEGTANRPVTVQLPDLAQLQADALRLGPGGTGGVRFQYPPGSALPFTSQGTEASPAAPGPADADVQVCSFSIPLITIVALFVFKLFLPIVVFVFQLWFLLALRFCIPPEVEIDAGSALDVAFGELGAGLDIDVEVAASLGIGGALQGDLDDALDRALGGSRDGSGETLAQRVKGALAAGALDTPFYAALARAALAQRPTPPPDQSGTPADPVFAPRVERNQVVEP